MTKLTYETREKHLEKNSEQQTEWKKITKKTGKEIFDVLSKQDYDTSFEIKQRDTYFQESYRYYNNVDFYFALKTIKNILGKTKLRDKTIDKIISFIKEIEGLKKALDTSSIQMKREELLAQKSNLSPYYRDEDGVGRIDFFWEQEKALEKELKALEEENQESRKEKTENKYEDNNEEEESRPGYRMDKD